MHSEGIIAGRVEMNWGVYSHVSDLSPWVCHQSVLTPKIILDNYKFDKEKKYFGDLHLWMRLKRDGIFNVKRTDLVISDFDLGGVGNKPEYLWGRLKERNQLDVEFENGSLCFHRFVYTLLMTVIWKAFGKTSYYRVMWLLGNRKRGLKSPPS